MNQVADPLGIRDASRFVMSRARSVRLNQSRIRTVARSIASYPANPAVTTWAKDHLDAIKLRDDELANFVLVLDALNFYFWGEPRWRVSWHGEEANGYWALTIALRRALQEGYPITDAHYLSTIPAADVAHILRGESVIPAFGARVHNLQEVGTALLRDHDGRFLTCINGSSGSAPALLRHIITLFPSFVDVRQYDSRTIPFYKRAQILVSDLHAAFGSRGITLFNDLSFLTAFADYKVPQVLQKLGVIQYEPSLRQRLQQMEEIEPGSAEEVEIRAATIIAVDELARATSEAGVALPAYAIDWHLWALGQREDGTLMPYHRTRTTAY
jgi:hypothetical protein